MVKMKAKLKAATILESMVAMTIIVVCLGIGTMIFVNILNNDRDRLSLKATLLLNNESLKTKKEKFFIDGEEKEEGFTIKKTFVKYSETENLLQMSLKAFDENGKLIIERKELIIIE
jgi:hypothetical protein